MRRGVLWAVIAVVSVVAVVGIGLSMPAGWRLAVRAVDALSGQTDAGERASKPIQTAELDGSGPGSLVSAVTVPGFAHTGNGRGMQSARVEYRSTNGDTGEETVVSGVVFTPLGSPPDGGWPVISLGHGSTGIDEACAPSLSDSLLGMAEPVAGFVKNGYAVAMTDYQGIGADGVHPYTDSKTAGWNMIDAVRALRHTFRGVSNRWLAFGGSQGGGAAWAADEQAETYAPDLDLVGAIANSPVTDVSGIVDKALAKKLTEDQMPAFQAVIESLARLHPDLDREDFRRGAAATYWTMLSSCAGTEVHDRAAAMKLFQPGDLGPSTPAAADRVRELLRKLAPPQQKLSAPLSVTHGSQDTYFDAQWTTDALARACALGGTIGYDLQLTKGHGDIDIRSQFEWLADRFAGKPVTSDCP
jgi:alpha-beta hydrolase superfamily lysophospholipase